MAMEWLELLRLTREGRVSVQVLNEYFANVTSKMKVGLEVDEAQADAARLLSWKPLPVDAALVCAGWAKQGKYGSRGEIL